MILIIMGFALFPLVSFLAIFKTPMVSVSRRISEEGCVSVAKANILPIKTLACAAIPGANFSASAVDVATADYFYDFREMAPSAGMNTYPIVDFRLFLYPAQSASQDSAGAN